MPPKLNITIAEAFIAILALASGCSNDPLPQGWQSSIPGVYAGSRAEFEEFLEFKPDGTFKHQVMRGGRVLTTESGKWTVPAGEYVIDLDSYTEFYDPVAHKFSTEAKPYVSYKYWPLPDIGSFDRISASAEFDYCLTRKPAGYTAPSSAESKQEGVRPTNTASSTNQPLLR